MTDWADHLKKFKKSNPDVTHVEALKEAKKTYKSKDKGKSSEKKSKNNSSFIPHGARPRNLNKANRLYREVVMKDTQLQIVGKLPKELRGNSILSVKDSVKRTQMLEDKQRERKLSELSDIVPDVPEEAKTMNSKQLRELIHKIKNPMEETV